MHSLLGYSLSSLDTIQLMIREDEISYLLHLSLIYPSIICTPPSPCNTLPPMEEATRGKKLLDRGYKVKRPV